METDKQQAQIEAQNAKISKLQEQLQKLQARYDKILANYNKDTNLHKYVTPEVMAQFKYVPFSQQKNKLFPHNPQAYEDYRKTYEMGNNECDRIYWDYLTKLESLCEDIYRKQLNIKELITKRDENISKLKNNEQKKQTVDELFNKVPQLKEFIEMCGEELYQNLLKKNERLKKLWAEYKEKENEFHEKYSHSSGIEWKNAYIALQRFKPKQPIMTEDSIRRDVEGWKRKEAKLFAERLKTEFGDILRTNLTIGADGNVNGTIVGEKKIANIQTIFAGGYNIQQLHTRLLIHEKI